jgi:hypothetical protein
MEVLLWLAVILALAAAMAYAARLRARLWPVLRLTWPSALLLLGGSAALMLTGQGKEIALGLRGGFWLHAVLMILGTLWWAAQSWFWSRLALNRRYGTDRAAWGGAAWAVTWLPRIYGIGSFVAPGFALVYAVRTAGPTLDLLLTGAALLAALALFILFLVYRAEIAAWLEAALGRALPQGWTERLRRLVAPAGNRSASTLGQPDAPPAALADEAWLTLAFLLASLALFGVLALTAGRDPVRTGEVAGAAAVIFAGLGTWVAVLSVLAALGRRWGFPLVPTVVAVGVALAWVRPINPVRTLGPDVCADPALAGGVACDPAKREDVAAAALRWAAMQKPDPNPYAPMPMVFVATAGGGLRAAYWTAAVLGRLADERLAFKDRLFAVSAVSGGSVGALGFTALVQLERDGRKPAGGYQELLGRAHARDLLAPTLAALMFDDPLRGLHWGGRPHGGRGAALESGFESAWSRAMGVRDRSPMDGPFLGLWSRPERGWVPALLLNATHLETGRRVVASSLKVQVEPFADAWDLHDLLGADVYATVTAHNSARFSWVSPAGELRPTRESSRGHVIDGGYFENFGAETLRDVVTGALAALAPSGRAVRPIVIQISSDPGMAVRDRARADRSDCDGRGEFLSFEDPRDLASVAGWWNELLAPVGGVLSSRAARGILASKDLARFLDCGFAADPNVLDPVFVHLAMPEDGPAPPLGWVMTPETRANIEAYLDEKENRAALDHVLALLGGGGGDGVATASATPEAATAGVSR